MIPKYLPIIVTISSSFAIDATEIHEYIRPLSETYNKPNPSTIDRLSKLPPEQWTRLKSITTPMISDSNKLWQVSSILYRLSAPNNTILDTDESTTFFISLITPQLNASELEYLLVTVPKLDQQLWESFKSITAFLFNLRHTLDENLYVTDVLKKIDLNTLCNPMYLSIMKQYIKVKICESTCNSFLYAVAKINPSNWENFENQLLKQLRPSMRGYNSSMFRDDKLMTEITCIIGLSQFTPEILYDTRLLPLIHYILSSHNLHQTFMSLSDIKTEILLNPDFVKYLQLIMDPLYQKHKARQRESFNPNDLCPPYLPHLIYALNRIPSREWGKYQTTLNSLMPQDARSQSVDTIIESVARVNSSQWENLISCIDKVAYANISDHIKAELIRALSQINPEYFNKDAFIHAIRQVSNHTKNSGLSTAVTLLGKQTDDTLSNDSYISLIGILMANTGSYDGRERITREITDIPTEILMNPIFFNIMSNYIKKCLKDKKDAFSGRDTAIEWTLNNFKFKGFNSEQIAYILGELNRFFANINPFVDFFAPNMNSFIQNILKGYTTKSTGYIDDLVANINRSRPGSKCDMFTILPA